VIPSRKLRLEFRGRIHGGMERAADAFLNGRESRQYLVKRVLPDDHDINIALIRAAIEQRKYRPARSTKQKIC